MFFFGYVLVIVLAVAVVVVVEEVEGVWSCFSESFEGDCFMINALSRCTDSFKKAENCSGIASCRRILLVFYHGNLTVGLALGGYA